MADEKDTTKPAAKPAARRRTTRKPAAAAAGSTPAKAKPATAATPKRRAAASPKPRTPARTAAKSRTTDKSPVAKATEKVGGKWAVAGGLAAIGAAATAALLSLRGSTAKKGAHTPDGKDASASFKAGIADENTIPDKK